MTDFLWSVAYWSLISLLLSSVIIHCKLICMWWNKDLKKRLKLRHNIVKVAVKPRVVGYKRVKADFNWVLQLNKAPKWSNAGFAGFKWDKRTSLTAVIINSKCSLHKISRILSKAFLAFWFSKKIHWRKKWVSGMRPMFCIN